MSLLYREWIQYKKRADHIKEMMIMVEAKIYTKHQEALDAKQEGAVSLQDGDYKLKVTKRLNRTIDQQKAAEMNGLGLAKKYSWSKKEYDLLSDADRKIANEAITTKVGKPTFSVEDTSEDN